MTCMRGGGVRCDTVLVVEAGLGARGGGARDGDGATSLVLEACVRSCLRGRALML